MYVLNIMNFIFGNKNEDKEKNVKIDHSKKLMNEIETLTRWKYSDTPWNDIVDMSELTHLIYDYGKHWKVDTLENLNNFFEENKDNCKLENCDINMIEGFKQRSPDAEVLRFFSNSADLQCVVCQNPNKKRYSIIFRGSEGFMDWLYDLLIVKSHLKDDIYVHKGFYKQLMHNETFTRIKEFVKKISEKNPDWEWFISGHSLGGALSTLAGYFFACYFPHKKWTVISLASPRVGNEAFKRSFERKNNLRHYRICNHRDIVTSIPMWGYYHVGHNLHYDASTSKWNDYGSFPEVTYALYRCWSPGDHSCMEYVKRLRTKRTAASV